MMRTEVSRAISSAIARVVLSDEVGMVREEPGQLRGVAAVLRVEHEDPAGVNGRPHRLADTDLAQLPGEAAEGEV
jgi:hypothetical protein